MQGRNQKRRMVLTTSGSESNSNYYDYFVPLKKKRL